ncbi:hypothetical protein Tco_0570622 [Tanacetum coccineum]
MNSELVKGSKTKEEGSSKRAGDELEREKTKKQKGDDDQEEAEIKRHIEIVKDDEVAIDAIPLATKPPVIVDYKIVKEGHKGFYHVIRANGSSKRVLRWVCLVILHIMNNATPPCGKLDTLPRRGDKFKLQVNAIHKRGKAQANEVMAPDDIDNEKLRASDFDGTSGARLSVSVQIRFLCAIVLSEDSCFGVWKIQSPQSTWYDYGLVLKDVSACFRLHDDYKYNSNCARLCIKEQDKSSRMWFHLLHIDIVSMTHPKFSMCKSKANSNPHD